MNKVLLGIRIIIEGIVLWTGSAVLWYIITDRFYHFFFDGRDGLTWSDAAFAVPIAALIICILTERRREIGKKIHTSAFVILNLASVAFFGVIIMPELYWFF